MGAGIAQVVGASGRRVSLHDAQPGATDRALEAMRKSLGKLEEKGGAPAEEVLARIEVVEGLLPADLMIEAVVEDAEVKEEIFRRADAELAAGISARLEHIFHPDRLARCCEPTSRQA